MRKGAKEFYVYCNRRETYLASPELTRKKEHQERVKKDSKPKKGAKAASPGLIYSRRAGAIWNQESIWKLGIIRRRKMAVVGQQRRRRCLCMCKMRMRNWF